MQVSAYWCQPTERVRATGCSVLLNKEVDRTLRHSKRNNNGVSFELKGYFIGTVFITFRRIRC